MAKSKAYLYGKNSVLERLRVNPASIKKIFIQENFKTADILDIAGSAKIPVIKVSEKELLKIKRADRLQGIVAETDNFTYTPFEKLLALPPEQKKSFLLIDNLNDPHNLGSIVRIAACFGGFSVVIPEHRSCEVNDTVIHVASGGENFVPVSMVTNMTTAIIKAKDSGYWVVGTVVEGGENIYTTALPFPICLVLGSEGKGIRHGINKHLDMSITLPMEGVSLSFNVAMATAIFCYEITKQRRQK